MEVAKYTVGVRFDFDPREQRRFDQYLSGIEKKLKKFQSKALSISLDVNKFDVDQKKLNFVLGNALDRSSDKLVFQIQKFDVDQSKLNILVKSSIHKATSLASAGINIQPHMQPMPRVTGGRVVRNAGVGGRAIENRLAQSVVYGGGLAGVTSRLPFAAPALGLIGGGYGLAQLNERNQQVVAAQLQTQAVVQQAMGANFTPQAGTNAFEFLRAQGNRVGFNYLEAAPDFNKLISGLTGAGMTVEQSQDVFKGFSELARVNKLDRVQQQRVFRALSQVAGKGKLQAEELTQQLAESLPGATALFARAYQQQTGGNLTGKEAIAKLMEDMKKGKVKSDILTFAGQLAGEQAGPGLEAASKASQAEQARFQNVVSDMAILASQRGVEEGFARIFRVLRQGLEESDGLVARLAEGFNEATKFADDLLLFPQSFVRLLEGRDSMIADWLGKDATQQLRDDWNSIRDAITAISQVGAPSWLPTLQEISKDIATQMRVVSSLVTGDFSGFGSALMDFVKGRVNMVAEGVATGPNFALRTAGAIGGFTVPQFEGPFGENKGSGYWSPMSSFGIGMPAVANNPISQESYATPDPFSKAMEKQTPNAFGAPQAKMDMKIDVSIKADGFDDLEEKTRTSLRNAVQSFVQDEYGTALLEFTEH